MLLLEAPATCSGGNEGVGGEIERLIARCLGPLGRRGCLQAVAAEPRGAGASAFVCDSRDSALEGLGVFVCRHNNNNKTVFLPSRKPSLSTAFSTPFMVHRPQRAGAGGRGKAAAVAAAEVD